MKTKYIYILLLLIYIPLNSMNQNPINDAMKQIENGYSALAQPRPLQDGNITAYFSIAVPEKKQCFLIPYNEVAKFPGLTACLEENQTKIDLPSELYKTDISSISNYILYTLANNKEKVREIVNDCACNKKLLDIFSQIGIQPLPWVYRLTDVRTKKAQYDNKLVSLSMNSHYIQVPVNLVQSYDCYRKLTQKPYNGIKITIPQNNNLQAPKHLVILANYLNFLTEKPSELNLFTQGLTQAEIWHLRKTLETVFEIKKENQLGFGNTLQKAVIQPIWNRYQQTMRTILGCLIVIGILKKLNIL